VKIHTTHNLFHKLAKLEEAADAVPVEAVVVDAVQQAAPIVAAVAAVINFLSISFNTCIIYP
jgi:hypothetical protein